MKPLPPVTTTFAMITSLLVNRSLLSMRVTRDAHLLHPYLKTPEDKDDEHNSLQTPGAGRTHSLGRPVAYAAAPHRLRRPVIRRIVHAAASLRLSDHAFA